MIKCKHCGQNVEKVIGAHLECRIEYIKITFPDTSLYNIYKRIYPEFFLAK